MLILVLQAILIVLGLFFLFTGTLGLNRLPDLFTRMHATAKCDTMGLGLVVIALLLRGNTWADAVKLIFVVVFVWFTSPTLGHLIAQAAWLDGTPMYGISDHPVMGND